MGLRSWKVTPDGKLTGITYSSEAWQDGENVATCKGGITSNVLTNLFGVPEDAISDLAWETRSRYENEWKTSHGLNSPDCKHGYYSFLRQDLESYGSFRPYAGHYFNRSVPTLLGVIEGYGETLIGSLGFRTMKARILALSFEGNPEIAFRIKKSVAGKIRERYPSTEFFDYDAELTSNYPILTPQEAAEQNQLQTEGKI